jgi:hypothetical protein
MSNFPFYEPTLQNAGAFHDLRSRHAGGFGWRGDRPSNQIKKIVVHHTVTNPKGNMLREVDEVAQIHLNSNGWGGIGYHIIISTETINGFAKVAYVGDVLSVRAHAVNSKGVLGFTQNAGNYWFLGISIIGRFDQGVMPSIEQLRSLKLVIEELLYHEDARLPSLANWNDVIAHKDVDYTACPGDWNRMKPLIMNTDVKGGSTPVPTPKPETGKPTHITVQAGWGLSHVATAAGLDNPGSEATWKAIYNLNQGLRGSWDWNSLNARMGAGDVLRVRPDAEQPKPTPKPIYEVLVDTNSKYKGEDQAKAIETFESVKKTLLDGVLVLQMDGKQYKDYKYDLKTVYSIESQTEGTPFSIHAENVDDLAEAIRIYTTLDATIVKEERTSPTRIRLVGHQTINGKLSEPQTIEEKELKGRVFIYEVIVQGQSRDRFDDKEKARVQFLNYVKDYKIKNFNTDISIQVVERIKLVGFEDVSYDEIHNEVVFNATVKYQEPIPEPSALKSILVLISDIIKSLFNRNK